MSKSRNWIFRIAAISLPIFLFIMTPSVGIWLSIAREGQIRNLTEATLSNERARSSLSAELSDSIISGLDEEIRSIAETQQEKLTAAISSRLADKEVQAKLSNIATTLFDSVTTGAGEVTIDPTPLADEFVAAINTLSGIGKISRSDLGDIEPIKLGDSEEPLPDLSPIMIALRAIALVSFLFSAISIFSIARTSKTPWRGLGIPLIVLGAFWSVALFAGIQVLKAQLESGTQGDVVPVIADNALSGMRLIGLTMFVVGVSLLATHFLMKRRNELRLQVAA